jgi:hypothetical protein
MLSSPPRLTLKAGRREGCKAQCIQLNRAWHHPLGGHIALVVAATPSCARPGHQMGGDPLGREALFQRLTSLGLPAR